MVCLCIDTRGCSLLALAPSLPSTRIPMRSLIRYAPLTSFVLLHVVNLSFSLCSGHIMSLWTSPPAPRLPMSFWSPWRRVNKISCGCHRDYYHDPHIFREKISKYDLLVWFSGRVAHRSAGEILFTDHMTVTWPYHSCHAIEIQSLVLFWWSDEIRQGEWAGRVKLTRWK